MLRYCYEPLVFLRACYLRNKAHRLKNQSAVTLYAEKVLFKAFKAIFMYAVKRAGKNAKNSKARRLYLERACGKVIKSIKGYVKVRKEIKSKRNVMKDKIESIDN